MKKVKSKRKRKALYFESKRQQPQCMNPSIKMHLMDFTKNKNGRTYSLETYLRALNDVSNELGVSAIPPPNITIIKNIEEFERAFGIPKPWPGPDALALSSYVPQERPNLKEFSKLLLKDVALDHNEKFNKLFDEARDEFNRNNITQVLIDRDKILYGEKDHPINSIEEIDELILKPAQDPALEEKEPEITLTQKYINEENEKKKKKKAVAALTGLLAVNAMLGSYLGGDRYE